MGGIKFLPDNKDNKLYSPAGVVQLFRDAVNRENGNIQAILDKPKYKSLNEMRYASALAVAIYEWMGDKYLIYPADNPDIHFVHIDENKKQKGFSVEIMTLFEYGQKIFNQDYKKLAKHVWDKKGEIDYDRTELLLVSRFVGKFNVNEFAREIAMHNWKFLRIWLCIYTSKDNEWNFFEVLPYNNYTKVGRIVANMNNIPY